METTQDVANELQREQEQEEHALGSSVDLPMHEALFDRPLSKKDTQLLENLQKLGFNTDVFGAIQVIEAYMDKITTDTAEMSTWLAGVADNIWNVLFTGGNDVELLFKGGIGVQKDQQNNNGGLFGTIETFKVAALAKKTTINMGIFFMDKLDLLAGVLNGDTAGTGDADSSRSGSGKSAEDTSPPLLRRLKTQTLFKKMRRNSGNDEGTATEEDVLFYMKGKTTLVEIDNAQLTGTIQTLVKHQDQINHFVDHDTVEQIIDILIQLVIHHNVKFDINTTPADLPNAVAGKQWIDHVQVTTQRFQLGGLVGYNGPVSVDSALKAVRNALNVISKKKAKETKRLQRELKRMNSKVGSCIKKVIRVYQDDLETAEIIAEGGRETCWEEDADLSKV